MPEHLNESTYFRLNNEINRPSDGKIPLHKDKEALEAFIKEHVIPSRKPFDSYSEKFQWLLKNDYLDRKLIDKYKEVDIEALYDFLKSKNFKFKSFAGAYKFYAQYAMKTDDDKEYLEDIEDRVLMNALTLADGDVKLAYKMAEEMITQRYQPATPTYLNAGKSRRGEFVSCYLISAEDSMASISKSINNSLMLSRIGGGVGINLANLRAAGDPIKKVDNASSGVLPVMKLLEDSFSYSNQLGQRNGAGAAYLNVFHPDIIDFLSTKKENADEKVRIKTLSLGLVVPDKFYELARNNEDMYLFSPYDVERIYNKPFSYVDITNKYDEMVENDEINKVKINARTLENEISKLQQESGYPYILNIDTANQSNPIKGRIIMSNLCSEILQVQQPSSVNEDQTFDELGTDISCNLGSTNIENVMNADNIETSIDMMVRALTTITDQSDIKAVPTVKEGNSRYHTIGLGAMGLHTYLAKQQIMYGSPEAVEFTDAYFRMLNFYTLKASNQIAKERNESFYEFEDSAYADGTYFERYLKEEWTPQFQKNQVSFENKLPTIEDWTELMKNIQTYGLYNAYRLAVAPTGSISYVNETSSSIHPIVHRIEERQEKLVGKIYVPASGLSDETMPYYVSAYDIDMRKVIDTYAAAQQHVDQGMSLTLFMRSEIPDNMYPWKEGKTNKMTTRDLNILRHYAHQSGVKSLYYVRTHTDGEEVGSNECESCTI